MLGKRILEVYDDQVLYGLPPSELLINTNLRAELLNSNGLQVITTDTAWTLREDLNTGMPSLSEVLNSSATCNTFRVPNTDIRSARRRSRYFHAEQSLISYSKQMESELSPEELKIRALEQAAANLTACARDAQERIMQLRQHLADRTVEPEQYRSLQQERWREERRYTVMGERAKAAQQELISLSRGGSSSERPVVDRQRANLASFFNQSRTKISLSFKTFPSFRTETIGQITPLSLRPPAFPVRVKVEALVIKFPKPREPLYARRNQPSQFIQTKDPPNPSPASIPSTLTDATTYSLATLSDDDIIAPGESFASIYSPAFYNQRSKADIMAELSPIAMPGYVMDLLDDLDYSFDEISLVPDSQNSAAKTTFATGGSSSTHTDKSPNFRNTVNISPKASSAAPSLLPITKPPPSASPLVRNGKRHAPAVSFGSFFHQGQDNEVKKDLPPPRRSVQLPSKESKSLRKLFRTKSTVKSSNITSIPELTELESVGVGRGPTLASRMRRPFSFMKRK